MATHRLSVHAAAIRAVFKRGLLMAVGIILSSGFAHAQFDRIRVPDALEAGQAQNFFLNWNGEVFLDGAVIELPEGCTVQQAVALDPFRFTEVALHVQEMSGPGSKYQIEAPERLLGPQMLIVQVVAGQALGVQQWSVTPFTVEMVDGRTEHRSLEAQQLTRRVVIGQPAQATGNRALALEPASSAPVLRRDQLPAFGSDASFTVEFWLKTVGLGQVVLSSWNGDANQAYPVEVVTDARGHLSWYWGRPGLHQSLATPEPVADGTWHHVALVYDAVQQTRGLLLDGVGVDSLRAPVSDDVENALPLVLGGRVSAAGEDREERFSGLIDELRFWDQARPASEVRRDLRLPLESSGLQRVVLGFEEAPERPVFERAPEGERTVATDLTLYFPVRDIKADVEGNLVELSWVTESTQAQVFRIERSADGHEFEEAGTLNEIEPEQGRQQYTFSDVTPDARQAVWYYRIRQQFEGGGEQTSGILKLGMGGGEPESVALLGSSPNPFNNSTVIQFHVEQPQHVQLSVWDVSGQQVDLLADGMYDAGTHQARFSADNLPSGIYFAHLKTDRGMQTVKMTLMK